MEAFGFLSFGRYGRGPGDPDARGMLHQAIDLAQGADELGEVVAHRPHVGRIDAVADDERILRAPSREAEISRGVSGTEPRPRRELLEVVAGQGELFGSERHAHR